MHQSIVPLDDEGDLILFVQDAVYSKSRQFLASSEKLTAASRVFATMLGPNFQEGQKLRAAAAAQQPGNGSQSHPHLPTIKLEEDDVDAMDFILSILHAKTERTMVHLTAERIVKMALQVDKYDCSEALMPWINAWCNPICFPVDGREKSRDIGYALLAAYLFRSPNFEAISAYYAKDLPPDFAQTWEKYDLLAGLPHAVWDGLTQEVTHTLKEIRCQVLRVAEDMRTSPYMMTCKDPDCLLCEGGETTLPSRCHRGMSDYFSVLQSVGIWPSLLPFDLMAVNKVVAMIEEIPALLSHRCTDGAHCRITREVDKLCQKVARSRDNMKGVPLPPLFWQS